MDAPSRPWRLWIDTGGTFTDCLGVDPTGEILRAKVLSSGSLRGGVRPVSGSRTTVEWTSAGRPLPNGFLEGCRLGALDGESGAVAIVGSEETGRLYLAEGWPHGACEVEIQSPDEAAVLAARIVTGSLHGEKLPPAQVRFATTRGTNALLERRGMPPVLFITRGFGDLLAIGNQQRPDLFAIHVVKTEPLCGDVVEVDERLCPDGSVEEELDLEGAAREARKALDDGHTAAAVALLHSYRNPEHEQMLAKVLLDMGFLHVSVSSVLSSRMKIVPRVQTTVVDAYLASTVGGYLEQIDRGLEALSLHIMTSAGGLVRHDHYYAKDSLLSGPAGGVVGAVAAAKNSDEERILAFDMGGTSTDVTRHDGQLEYRSETVVGDAHLVSPSLAVETVAAGGGSVCSFDGRQFKVGPQSAGAIPGPACYGNGGPLTLTDVNLLLGRLLESHFPFQVDRAAAAERSLQVEEMHRECSGVELGSEELLFGFLQIANEKMAGAVRAISLRAGYDPGDYALLTFGGAGPQHACALAELLEIGRVLVPPDAALLSAFGLGQARMERFAERQVLELLEDVEERLGLWFFELETEALWRFESEGGSGQEARVEHKDVFLRFAGQEATLKVQWEPEVDVAESFASAYEDHFGYRPPGRSLEVESLRLLVSGGGGGTGAAVVLPPDNGSAVSGTSQQVFTSRGWMEGLVVERQQLALDNKLAGPGLVFEQHTVTVVEPGWEARLDGAGALLLEKA